MTSIIEANEKGFDLVDRIMGAIATERAQSERTVQSRERVLGMSDLGGCREYIRATITGQPKGPQEGVKWAAEVGTAVGDHVEKIVAKHLGMDIQETTQLVLPRSGIRVTGHLDEVDVKNDLIADNKTVDELGDVRREGPSYKNKVQISGYLVAAIQAARLTENATGHLVYFDRSGKDKNPYVWSVNLETAMLILDSVEDRLEDVTHAIATGTRNGRDGKLMTDEPESWCYAVSCPFYSGCWDGYTPTGKIEHPRQLDALRRFVEARDDEKAAASRKKTAREDLLGVEGESEEGYVVRWTLSQNQRGDGTTERLDVRPFTKIPEKEVTTP